MSSSSVAKEQRGDVKSSGEGSDESLHRLEIAYADHRDNRMIILGGAVFDSVAEQDREFDKLPALADSDFIVDYHDADGLIAKDKCVSRETVETVLDQPIAELIEGGRKREDELTAELRRGLARAADEHSPAEAASPGHG